MQKKYKLIIGGIASVIGAGLLLAFAGRKIRKQEIEKEKDDFDDIDFDMDFDEMQEKLVEENSKKEKEE